jgi:hypothetical protein
MQPFWCAAAVLAVLLVYYTWRAYHHAWSARKRLRHERVAYMLWVMAQRTDSQNRPISVN